MKFDVGDSVKCLDSTDADRYLTKHEIYEVEEVFASGQVRLRNAYGMWDAYRFGLVLPRGFTGVDIGFKPSPAGSYEIGRNEGLVEEKPKERTPYDDYADAYLLD